ncbi:Protein of unknown function [Gryllus bimaculatus]|nr:Protein of unknown function [Gryllus bimaculatus]
MYRECRRFSLLMKIWVSATTPFHFRRTNKFLVSFRINNCNSAIVVCTLENCIIQKLVLLAVLFCFFFVFFFSQDFGLWHLALCLFVMRSCYLMNNAIRCVKKRVFVYNLFSIFCIYECF